MHNIKINTESGWDCHILTSDILELGFDYIKKTKDGVILLITQLDGFYEIPLTGDFGKAVYAECLRVGLVEI